MGWDGDTHMVDDVVTEAEDLRNGEEIADEIEAERLLEDDGIEKKVVITPYTTEIVIEIKDQEAVTTVSTGQNLQGERKDSIETPGFAARTSAIYRRFQTRSGRMLKYEEAVAKKILTEVRKKERIKKAMQLKIARQKRPERPKIKEEEAEGEVDFRWRKRVPGEEIPETEVEGLVETVSLKEFMKQKLGSHITIVEGADDDD